MLFRVTKRNFGVILNVAFILIIAIVFCFTLGWKSALIYIGTCVALVCIAFGIKLIFDRLPD